MKPASVFSAAHDWPRLQKIPCRVVFAAVVSLIVVGCAVLPSGAGDDGGDPIRAAYVLLGDGGTAIARVITTDASCPSLSLDGESLAMNVRAVPAALPLRPTRSSRADSKPSLFPVLTCEAIVPSGAQRASAGGHTLASPANEVTRIVVIGDSGCRIKAADAAYQNCNDVRQWPFAQVAIAAAATRPDLVIHVGDYHYRENACRSNDAGCAGSPWGYGWDAWNADFFAPARPLLASAPWIFVRGNHESCDRAGQGWWRFLDSRPLQPGRDCNNPADDGRGNYASPFAVPLSARTQFIVFDSSNAQVDALPRESTMYGIYTAQMRQAMDLMRGVAHNFFLDHHPILGFAPNPAIRPPGVYPGNASLQSVLAPINGAALFPANVEALLSGHDHLFEMASFSTPQPTQLISGNAGATADTSLPIPLPDGASVAPGAMVAGIVSTSQYGFLTLERDAFERDVWRIDARDRFGRSLTTCILRDSKTTCSPDVLH